MIKGVPVMSVESGGCAPNKDSIWDRPLQQGCGLEHLLQGEAR